MSTKPVISQFSQLAEMLVHRYERYLPTAFDESLSLLEKVNKIIQYMNDTGRIVNDVITQWNEVMEWVMTDGINENVTNRLDEMLTDGTFDTLINQTILGSKANIKVQDTEPTQKDTETYWYDGIDGNVQIKNYNGTDWYNINPNTLDTNIYDSTGGKALELSNRNILSAIINDNQFEVNGEIESTFNTMIDALSVNDSEEVFNVALMTDNHYEDTPYSSVSLNHYKYLAEISDRKKIDCIVVNGDNVNGNTNKLQNKKDTNDISSLLHTKSKCDVFMVKGNHDDGSYYARDNDDNKTDNVLTYEEIKEMYHANKELYGEQRNNGSSLYFFKDYEQHKIRVIGLDSFDCPVMNDTNGENKYPQITEGGFRQDQLYWLSNTALQLPDNTWQVLIFCHAPIIGAFGFSDTQHNGTILRDILVSFKDGTAITRTGSTVDFEVNVSTNFTSQGASKIIAFISGHLHIDGQTVFNGINCIQTDNDLPYPTDVRVWGTSSEPVIDVFSIDPVLRNITIKRFGYGSDRSYSY